MSRRAHLGSVYMTYPAKTIGEWLRFKFFKLIAAIICCIIWSGIYYVFLGVVNFLKNQFLAGAQETTAWELFQTEASHWVLGITCFIVIYYSLTRKSGEKKKKTTRG